MIYIFLILLNFSFTTPRRDSFAKVINTKGEVSGVDSINSNNHFIKTGSGGFTKLLIHSSIVLEIYPNSQVILNKKSLILKTGYIKIALSKDKSFKLRFNKLDFLLSAPITVLKTASSKDLTLFEPINPLKPITSENNNKSIAPNYRKLTIDPQKDLTILKGSLKVISKSGLICKSQIKSRCFKVFSSKNQLHNNNLTTKTTIITNIFLPIISLGVFKFNLLSLFPKFSQKTGLKSKGGESSVSQGQSSGSMCLDSSSSSNASNVSDSTNQNIKPPPTTKLIMRIIFPKKVHQ